MSKFDLLSSTPPQSPEKWPGFVRHAISKVPRHMQPAAANALFPAAEQHVKGTEFCYIDGTTSEPNGMEVCCGPSAVGKGFLDPMINAISRHFREHDVESRCKLLEWSRTCNSRGQNKDKPQRPTDCAILLPEPDMTSAAFIQILMDAEAEGGASIYTDLFELSLIDACCGGHKKVTKAIRLNFDTKHWGAERATPAGITGNPIMRWKWHGRCVPEEALIFFKDCLTNGTLGRIGFSYVPKPSSRKIPRQGKYDDAYKEKLEEYLLRLRCANGSLTVPRLNKHIERLSEELNDISDLSDDPVFESYANRSLRIAWMKGCILWVAEGYRWSKEIQDFVEWSLYYDLWSKLQIFSPQMRKAQNCTHVDVRKYGPVNMLNLLKGDSFSKEQLEQLRLSREMPAYCDDQLHNWINRKFITYSAQTGLYTKTEEYLRKHPQTTD